MTTLRRGAGRTPDDPGRPTAGRARSWLLPLDHRRVAGLQLVGVVAAAAIGAALGLALRVELLGAYVFWLDPARHARTLTLHGLLMVYLVLVPGIPATLGSFLLPLRLGTPGLAYPRLNLAALYLWVLGALLLGLTAFGGGADATNAALPPPATGGATVPAFTLAALVALTGAATLRAVVIVATLHAPPPPRRAGEGAGPLEWSLYAHSAVTLLTAPVLALAAVALVAERHLDLGLFDPARGGDPARFEHPFWFGAHGALYAALLPALGVITEIVTAFARRPLASRRSVAFGLSGLALIGVIAWGAHLPTRGHSVTLTVLFSLLSLLGAVPATHLVGTWLATLAPGARPSTPLLFALGSALCFVLGALSGLFLATPSLAVHLHGTTFVVGHAHLLFGSFLLAVVAGAYFWWPLFAGAPATEPPGRAAALVTTAGVVAANLPLLLLGARGLPRRWALYPVAFESLQRAAGAGSLLLAIGLVAVTIHLGLSRRRRPAEGNPWGAPGPEWGAPAPPRAPMGDAGATRAALTR